MVRHTTRVLQFTFCVYTTDVKSQIFFDQSTLAAPNYIGVSLINSYVPLIAGAQSNQRSKKLNHAKEGGVACYLAGLCLASQALKLQAKGKEKDKFLLKAFGLSTQAHTKVFKDNERVKLSKQSAGQAFTTCTTYTLKGIQAIPRCD